MRTTTNGLAVARRLERRYPEMRVLFLSAQPGADLRRQKLLPKGAPLLPEPVAAEDPLHQVKRLTETKTAVASGNARPRRRSRAAGARRAA
ncbi:MAG TPA: hypothetical protein VKV17_03495 [Bryobacteraceae bacterium]|nr:hypothetical protein [Bryobacteraceae bacterium]